MSRRQWFLRLICFGVAALFSARVGLGRVTVSSDPQYILDRWEIVDGLPENSATAIVQTPDGYLWFGTFNGLVRFDGIHCTVFDPSNTPELPSGDVVNLHLDREGALWVSTGAGLARMRSGLWKRMTPAIGWAGNIVRTFSERPNGDLLLTTFDGHVIEYRGGEFHELKPPPGDFGQGYLGTVDEKGEWWVAQGGGVWSWNGSNWVKRTELSIGAGESVRVGPARGGGNWFLIGLDLIKLKEGRETERRRVAAWPGSFWSLSEDRSGNVWICTYDRGLARVAPDGSVKRWNKENGLLQDNARVVLEDGEENLWVGTSGSGLVRLKAKRFYSFGGAEGLPEENVKSVTQGPGGELLLATYGKGLFSLDKGEARRVSLVWDGADEVAANIYLQSLLYDSKGTLWVAGLDEGVLQMAKGESKILSRQHTGRNVFALFEDSRNRVWSGGNDSVVVFDRLGMLVFGKEEGLRGTKFRCFGEAETVWTASSEGVFQLGLNNFVEVTGPRGESIREVTCMLPDGANGMWMGTTASGLAHWRDGTLTWVGNAAGLPVKTIHGMVDDGLGFFWLASNRGIIRVSKEELQKVVARRLREANFIVMGLGDGLPTLECSGGQQPNCLRDKDGRLWFATLRGAAMIDPKSFRINSTPPRLYIEEVSWSDHEGRRHRVPHTPGIVVKIPPGSTRLEARLAGLSFRAPEDVTYFYRLRNQGKVGSVDSQKENILSKERLPHGEYILDVSAKNGDGVRTAQNVTLGFVVQAYFWETLWFRLGAVIAAVTVLVGGTWGTMRFRIRRELERLRHQQALHESEERYRAVVEFSPIGVAVSVDEKLVFLNPAIVRMVGANDPKEVLGKSIYEYMHPSVREAARERRRKALEDGVASPGLESKMLQVDGTPRQVEGFAVPFTYGGKRAVLNFVIDITDRKAAQLEKEKRDAEFRQVAGQLLRLQDEERRRIGRELHDSTGQTLAALEINLGMLARRLASSGGKEGKLIEECMELATQCSGEIRTTSYLLHPPLLDEVGLSSALRWYADGFTKRSEIAVKLRLPEAARRFSPEVELSLFRVVQEALTNIHRHSGSKTASIELEVNDSEIILRISDEGSGIDGENLRLFREGHSNLGVGISGMRERIRQLGGELTVESGGDGTRVFVRLPDAAMKKN